MNITRFLFLCIAMLGCSVVDGGDRDDLERQISILPVTDLAMLRLWAARKAVHAFLAAKGDNHKIGECRVVYSPEYHPDVVAAEVGGSNVANPDQMNRLADSMTIGQVVDALISSPIPPPLPGFATGGAFEMLLPTLCGLGAGWGCPGDPTYPGGDQ